MVHRYAIHAHYHAKHALIIHFVFHAMKGIIWCHQLNNVCQYVLRDTFLILIYIHVRNVFILVLSAQIIVNVFHVYLDFMITLLRLVQSFVLQDTMGI
jgi:hypothetical protein